MRWWRVFIDKITGRPKEHTVAGPKRRRAERYPYRVAIEARCGSWPEFVDLFTGDVSSGGLFIPTDERAQPGESIDVAFTLPDGKKVQLTGKVTNRLDTEQAAELGKQPGLGIQLDNPDDEASVLFEVLLREAKGALPTPPRRDDSQPGVLDDEGAGNPEPAAPPAAAAPAAATVTPPVVGIDLGTTYTAVACVIGKKVVLCDWPDGTKSSPSVIAFPDAQTCLIGAAARARLGADPLRTVASPKRLLGRRYDDREIQGFLGSAPYRTLEGPDGTVLIEIGGNEYAITQLISYLLREARDVAEETLGQRVTRCVLTCPVSFDEQRAGLLRRAAQLAGLEVQALIDEPSAAALANRFDPGFGGVVGVYDFGGGTFDFSLVDVSKGDFVVLATAGDTWLGGDDFDRVLAEAAADQFWRQRNVDLRKQAVEWQKLVFSCEQAKRTLSQTTSAEIFVKDALRTADGMVDLHLSVTRASFERTARPLIDRSLATCAEALDLLDMQPSQMTAIYLSGGTTYIPVVRQALAERFGVPVRTGVPPEHAVCLGAAIHAAQLQYRMARTTLDARDD